MEKYLGWVFVAVPIVIFAVVFFLLHYGTGGGDISAWLDKPMRDATIGDVMIFVALLILGTRK